MVSKVIGIELPPQGSLVEGFLEGSELIAKRRSSPRNLLFSLLFSVCLLGSAIGQDIRATRLDNGLMQLESVHLRLITDMPIDEAVESLPRVFDQAIEQWCSWFDVDVDRAEAVKVTAYLMLDRSRFVQLNLLPEDVSSLRHGYQIEDQLFLTDQPSDYYRRHLLLHEGTHWFIWKYLGGIGPPWLDEGTCELLGTHVWEGGKLTLGVIPDSRVRFPYWGRLKWIRESFDQQNVPRLQTILNYNTITHRTDEPYAWSWAAVLFFKNHPRYKAAFDKTTHPRTDYSNRVDSNLKRQLVDSWPIVEAEWRIFLTELDYGFSPSHSMPDLKTTPLKPLEQKETRTVRSDRGWQSTGLVVQIGQRLRITSHGKTVIRAGETNKNKYDWNSEPQGITLEFVNGQPLGRLVATIVPITASAAEKTLAKLSAHPIGRSAVWTAPEEGVLLLKINEPSSELFDNSGEITVTIEQDAS